MNSRFENYIKENNSKGGIIGAIIGALLSIRIHRSGDSVVKKAGKTAVFTGLGFLLGALIDKKITGRNQVE
jgi:hypothetical protein